MRLSVNETDPGFVSFCKIRDRFDPRVTCDGVEVPQVVTADEEEGHILALALNERGEPYVDGTGRQVATHEKRGVVAIELRPLPRASHPGGLA